jgi:hypothetical protein
MRFPINKIVLFKRSLLIFAVVILILTGWYILSSDLLISRNPYEMDLADYNRIDPDLIQYYQIQALEIPGQKPRALCVDQNNNIFVAVDSFVIKFNSFGSIEKTFSVETKVNCLTTSPTDDLYLGYKTRIALLDQVTMSVTDIVNLPETSHLTSIAVDQFYIYAADAGMRIVNKYNHRGNLITTFGEQDEAIGRLGFIIPSPYFDLSIEPENDLWIVNPGQHILEKYQPDGKLVHQWGMWSAKLDGFCGCCNPTHIARMHDGRFVTSEKGLVRVKIYTADGRFDRVVAGPDNFSRYAVGLDLAVDSEDRILVLDPGAQMVRIFQSKELN